MFEVWCCGSGLGCGLEILDCVEEVGRGEQAQFPARLKPIKTRGKKQNNDKQAQNRSVLHEQVLIGYVARLRFVARGCLGLRRVLFLKGG